MRVRNCCTSSMLQVVSPSPRYRAAGTTRGAAGSFELTVAGGADGIAGSWDAGRRTYFTRIVQLNLACTHCHDASWGKTLLAESVSQGHPNGWPAYRLEWQSMGSLERRLRACFFGVRAEMPAYGSDDMLALELYLTWHAEGLTVAAPGVRC